MRGLIGDRFLKQFFGDLWHRRRANPAGQAENPQPPVGREVYATDMVLGHVERVIINPHNRRVTAFVTRGNFPDLLRTDEHEWHDERPQQERRVVVPIRVVRYETVSSVLLNVSGCEAARYRDFDSADFVSPPEGWQPPYPYHRNDVLFKQESSDEPKS